MLEFANEYLITIINTLDDLVKRGHKTDGEISREMKIKKKKNQIGILELKYSIQK